ncbi:MAG: small multi-drug export protein [Firmicutes bacterium]|nr:small multi-drug export protein [Bacillota bacterium]
MKVFDGKGAWNGMVAGIPKELVIPLLAALPYLELRGAIPVAASIGMPPAEAFLLAVAGNLFPVLPMLLLSRYLLSRLRRGAGGASGLLERLEKRAARAASRMRNFGAWGLLLFVAVPLPATGVYSGALVAAFLGMSLRQSLGALTGGVVLAGLIVTAAAYGLLHGLDFLLP